MLKWGVCGQLALTLVTTSLVPVVVAISAAYRLHRVALPLVGAPSFLRLHQAAIFEPVGHSAPALLLDFLPSSPEDPETLGILLSGGSVNGELRTKELSRFPPHRGTILSTSPHVLHIDPEVLASRLRSTYDTRLQLMGNNCITFVDDCLQRAHKEAQCKC